MPRHGAHAGLHTHSCGAGAVAKPISSLQEAVQQGARHGGLQPLCAQNTVCITVCIRTAALGCTSSTVALYSVTLLRLSSKASNQDDCDAFMQGCTRMHWAIKPPWHVHGAAYIYFWVCFGCTNSGFWLCSPSCDAGLCHVRTMQCIVTLVIVAELHRAGFSLLDLCVSSSLQVVLQLVVGECQQNN
jgi:hypothetical protein